MTEEEKFCVVIFLHSAFNDVAPADISLVVERIESLVCQKFLELARQCTRGDLLLEKGEPVLDTNNSSIKTTSVNFAIDPFDLDRIFPVSKRSVLASKDFADAVHTLIVEAYVKQRREEIRIFEDLLPKI